MKGKGKSARSLFFRKKEVVSKKKILRTLKKEKRDVETELKKLSDMYNIPEELEIKLIMSSLIVPFKANKTSDGPISILDMQEKIEKDHEANMNKLNDIKSSLTVTSIDLLLEKIKCIQENLK